MILAIARSILLLPVIAVVDETAETAAVARPHLILVHQLMGDFSGYFLANIRIRRRPRRVSFERPSGGGRASRRYAASAGVHGQGRFQRRGVAAEGGRRGDLFDGFGGGEEGSDLDGRRRRRRGAVVFLDEVS